MSNKTALVTGASRGIGRGIAIELARAGCRVAINYAGNVAAADEAEAAARTALAEARQTLGLLASSLELDELLQSVRDREAARRHESDSQREADAG